MFKIGDIITRKDNRNKKLLITDIAVGTYYYKLHEGYDNLHSYTLDHFQSYIEENFVLEKNEENRKVNNHPLTKIFI